MSVGQLIFIGVVALIVFLVAWRFRDRITNKHIMGAFLFFLGILATIGFQSAARKAEDIKRDLPL